MNLQSNPREMIENARVDGYAVGAYNMHSDCLLYTSDAADE